jgi:hypothetical protein
MASRAYEDYLQSDTWQVMREARLAYDGYACSNCHRRGHLQVHHLYYTRHGRSILGHEQMADLLTLCDPCHRVLTQRRQEVFGTGPTTSTPHFWKVFWVLMVGVALFLVILRGLS